MKIADVPEIYKIYTIKMSNGSEYEVSGKTKENLLAAVGNFVQLTDGTIINKSYIVEIKIDREATRELVRENKDKIGKEITLSEEGFIL